MNRPYSDLYRFTAEAARAPFGFPFPKRRALFNRYINGKKYEKYWDDAPVKWVRSKVHGFWIPCDLQIFSGRIAYYFRRWYELDTQSLILTLLRPGETFVDIGGNVGMASLTAAKAVGPTGRILAFEPNPPVYAIFAESIARNAFQNVQLLNAAVSGTPGQLEMFVPDHNHGEASFGVESRERPGKTVTVEVVDGKALEQFDAIHLVKIDVEGHEQHVIEAIAGSLATHRPFVITELCEKHLRRSDSSVSAIVELMSGLGYRPFCYRLKIINAFSRAAELYDFDRSSEASSNVLWVPEDKLSDPRLKAFVPVAN